MESFVLLDSSEQLTVVDSLSPAPVIPGASSMFRVLWVEDRDARRQNGRRTGVDVQADTGANVDEVGSVPDR